MSAKLSAMLAYALVYAERGYCLFPCRPREKKPLTKNGFLDATTDPATIKRWWTENPDANIAIACARSKIVVIDVDHPSEFHKLDVSGEVTLAALVAKLGKLPETVEAVTGGGGRHLVFAAPANVQFKAEIGTGLEIKHNGYILVENSIHPDTGRPYRWVVSPFARMPADLTDAWLAAMVKPAPPKVATHAPVVRTTTGCTPYGRKAVVDELEKVRTTPEGGRDTELNKSAFACAQLCAGGEIEDVREELVAAGLAAGLEETETRKTVESGWRKGLETPRKAPPREGRPMSSLAAKTAKTAITATATGTTEKWADLQSLVVDVARKPYPVDALPPVFQPAVVEVQRFVQAPVAMVAMSAMGAASLAVQALVNVTRAEGLESPGGLFLLVLAPSGERKSTIDNNFGKPIRDYELDEAEKGEPLVSAFKAELSAWESKKRGLESKIEKASKEGKSSDNDEDRLRKLTQSEPKAPRVPRLLYNDATMEALAYGLAKNWPSAGIVSSEAGSVFGAHSMNKETIMRTLSLYNVSWDGGSIRIDRRSVGGSYWVRNARLTMSLQVQPGTFLEFLKTDRGLARDSGFLARILIACPESTQGSRLFREPPQNRPALARFNKRIAEILKEPVNIDENGGLTPVVLTLTSEAKAAWIQFHDRIEAELAIGGSLCDVRDVASKIADNACRIAAIFQVFEHGLGAIGLPLFESAARIAEWHLNEARRFFGEFAMPEENAEAAALDSWLLEYCRTWGVSSVPVSMIQKSGPSKLRGKVALESTLLTLEELGRARLAKGQGKARLVEINPALLATAVIAVHAVMAQPAKKAVI